MRLLTARSGEFSRRIVAIPLVAKERQLSQHAVSPDRFPRHVFGNCETNNVAGSGNISQKSNDLAWRHPPTWNIGLGGLFGLLFAIAAIAETDASDYLWDQSEALEAAPMLLRFQNAFKDIVGVRFVNRTPWVR